MPYIITTKTRNQSGDWLARLVIRFESRRAVGTLDEAREITWETVVDAGADLNTDRTPFRAAVELSESGGTVGPLPDGTVIEAEPITYGQLRVMVDGDDSYDEAYEPDEEVSFIAAYNAAQED